MERRAAAFFGLGPNLPSVAFDDGLTCSESDARPGARAIQTLEHPENVFLILGFESHAIVAHGNGPVVVLAMGLDLYFAGAIRTSILDAVPDQILHQPGEMHVASRQRRKRRMRNPGSAFIDLRREIFLNLGDDVIEVDR